MDIAYRHDSLFPVWEPLCGQCRPIKCSAVEDVVDEMCVLLPDFVLFIDDLGCDELGIITFYRRIDWKSER